MVDTYEADIRELVRKRVRVSAELVARRFATVLAEMVCDEFASNGNTERFRILREKRKTATEIADMIAGLSVRDDKGET